MYNSIELRKSTFELYKKAILEVSESANLLVSKELNLSIITFTRQLFEVARTLEILAENYQFTSAYYLEVRNTELSKIEKSNRSDESTDKYISNVIQPDIEKLKECMVGENVELGDFEEAKKKWNRINKDIGFYNKISEGLHLDINFLIVHYMQNKNYSEINNSQIDWDENIRLDASKQTFNYWLKRCDDAITSIKGH